MLKNVLSLLLSRFYSKKESELVGHQALPSANGTYLFSNKSVSNWGTVSTGVAPYDGFLVLNANGDGTSDSASIFVATPCVKSMITFPFPSAGCSTWAPIAKGEAWAVQGSSAKQISLELCKTIGGSWGGKSLSQLLLQGGGLCLSHWYSSLRRSFLSVRRHGSATSLKPSYQGARESPISLTLFLKTTQRRATELYVSILLTLRGQSSNLLLISGVAYFTVRTKKEFIKCSRFLSQRVKRSPSASHRIQAKLVSSSFRPLVLNEVKGGASC